MDTLSKTDDGAGSALPTALELAFLKNPIDATPRTTAVFRAIAEGKPMANDTLLNGKSVAASLKFTEMVVWVIADYFDFGPPAPTPPQALASAEQISQLKKVETKMRSILAEM